MSAFLCNFVVFYLIYSFQLTYSIQTTGRSEKKHQRDTVFAWKGCLQSSYEEPKPHDEALIKENIVFCYVQFSQNVDYEINQTAVSVVRYTNLQSVHYLQTFALLYASHIIFLLDSVRISYGLHSSLVQP